MRYHCSFEHCRVETILIERGDIMSDEALLKFKKIYRAKNYMDDMRQGIDPVSKLPVPDDSVIRQEKVINCFTFISGLLDEMLNSVECEQDSASDVLQEGSKMKKASFHLTNSQIRQIKTSSSPLAVSTFIRRINAVVDKQSTESIHAKDIHGWLTAKGFLVERSVQIIKEEKEYIPAANASAIGVVDIIKQRDNGQPDHHSIKLTQIGQQFVLDNIGEIAKYAEENK